MARDVLPTGVRRRRGPRDFWLPAVLSLELLAGVAAGAVWESGLLSRGPAPVAPVVAAPPAVRAPVVVLPPPVPPARPPVLRHVPRSPFAPQG